jgi:hypothetical protein
MASKRNPSDPAGPSARPPRRPPTIELESTEFSADAASNPSNPSQESAAAAPPPGSEADHPDGTTWLPSGNVRALVATGIVAGSGVLGVILLFWSTGFFGGGSSALDNRIAGIEAQLRELAARPVPTRNDTKTIEELSARLARVENSASAPPSPLSDPALANRLASAENATKTFADNIGSLKGHTEDLAAAVRDLKNRLDASPPADKAEIEALNNRIAALERAAGMMETEIGKRATVASDRAVRLALATAALRTAVERGEPFTVELVAARPLAPENALAELEPFAASGVPSNATLARELTALVPALRRAAASTPSDEGFFSRLWSNAGRLVRVRPAGETAGDDPAAIITRIDLKVASADVSGALAELAKLSEPVRAPAQAWVDKVNARVAAVETSRKVAGDAINALGRAAP